MLLERPSLRWDYNIKIDLNGTDVTVYVEIGD